MFRIGVGKAEMTYFKDDTGMLGYGRYFHRMQGVETPQYARAFVFEKNGKKLVYVCTDVCFCTEILKQGVLESLQLDYPNEGYTNEGLMIVGQHTHSTAGGYSQYLMYNLSMPGFREDVYQTYRQGIVAAIVQANARLQSAVIRRGEDSFDPEAEVCFNRSLSAYNQNPEITEKLKPKQRHLAADRTMRLLLMERPDGTPIASLNWFGVHTTSVSNRRRKVCFDNKGYASEYLEEHLNYKYSPENKDIVTAFAQSPTADISPNFHWQPTLRTYRGKFKDDYESAGYNGRMQSDKATEIIDKIAQQGELIEGELDSMLIYANLVNAAVDADFTGGLEGQATGFGALGMAFLEGTTDGQGAAKVVGHAYRLIFNSAKQVELMAARMNKKNPEYYERLRRHFETHAPKAIVMNMSRGVVAGAKYPERLVIPGFVDPIVKFMKFVNKVGRAVQKPWCPEVLPLQIFIIGQLAIVGVPSEISTIAGERLRKTVLDVLQARGVKYVQVNSYANEYAGYITTHEEYRMQRYEGGHTLYGKWTLAAYQTYFRALAREMLKPEAERFDVGTTPMVFRKEQIWMGMDDITPVDITEPPADVVE